MLINNFFVRSNQSWNFLFVLIYPELIFFLKNLIAYLPSKSYGWSHFLCKARKLFLMRGNEFCFWILKPYQNKKAQRNFRYPTRKQSFSKEKDCFFVEYLKFFWPFLFWNGFSSRALGTRTGYRKPNWRGTDKTPT